jgi:WhiB family redox-sensing transcriptional regulator
LEAGENLMQFGPRPQWMRDALCHEHPELSWFPVPGPSADNDGPRSICRRCLVRLDCLAYALEHKMNYGIWGGMTALDRRHLLAERDGQPMRQSVRRAKPVPQVAVAAEMTTTTSITSSVSDAGGRTVRMCPTGVD